MKLASSRRFPADKHPGRRRHRVVLGAGGNLGDVPKRLDRLVDYLAKRRDIRVVRTGPLLENPPFGYLDQPDFVNSVIVVDTALPPIELLRRLLWIEKRFGRRRSFKNAPRTLDLDIIFYDEIRLRTARLTIPHPHWRERPSVTIPLAFVKDTTA